MSVFPITWADKQDSPELLAYLAQYGSEFYVSATEINKIRDGLNELYNSVGGGTGLINMNGFYPVGQDYIFPAFRVWKINGTVYSNATQISINIPYAAAGKHRIDAIAAMDDDTIIRVPGPEVLISNSAAEASIPPGSVRVTAIPVNESGFGIPEPPILINQFVKKNEFAENLIGDSGDVTLLLDTESTSYRLTGAVTSLKGFDITSLFTDSNSYIGKEIRVVNNSGTDFPIKHNSGTVNVQSRFPSEVDFVFKNNHVVIFKLVIKTDVLYAEFDSVSTDVSAAEPLEVFVDITVDGVVTTANSWATWIRAATNYNQSMWTVGYSGTGTTVNLSSVIDTAKAKNVPAGYKLDDAWFSCTLMNSSGTTPVRIEFHTNEYTSGQAKTTLSGNQLLVQQAWTMIANAAGLVENKKLTINSHSTFTDLTKLFIFFRFEGSSGGVTGINLKLKYKKQ